MAVLAGAFAAADGALLAFAAGRTDVLLGERHAPLPRAAGAAARLVLRFPADASGRPLSRSPGERRSTRQAR